MGFYKTEYHLVTDAHCDETRVRKIWSARDAENHTASLEHLERFKMELERLNKALDDAAEKNRLEIIEILQESDEWLELADRLLQARVIYEPEDIDFAEDCYHSGRALYLRLRQHAHENTLCEEMNKSVAENVLNLVGKCMQTDFLKIIL